MTISDLIGIPYQPKGRTLASVDCWGLACVFHRHLLGQELPSYLNDYTHPNDRKSVADAIVNNYGNWLQVDEPKFGDIIIFNLLGLPLHCGVYLADGDFIHSLKGSETCIERLDSITWERRVHRIIRWHKK